MVATLLTLIIKSMTAYSLAKVNLWGRQLRFGITLSTIMIALQVILIPIYLTAQLISSLGELVSAVLAGAGGGMPGPGADLLLGVPKADRVGIAVTSLQ